MSEILWVNAPLRDAEVQAEFREIKSYLGIRTNADVIRHLVREKAREIRLVCGEGAARSPAPVEG